MSNPESSHYIPLLHVSVEKERMYPNGLAVTVLECLKKRSDNSSVFDEAEAFSGIEQSGIAESGLTVTACPHVKATISREVYLDSARMMLNTDVKLSPDLAGVELFPPQTIVWWRDNRSAEDEGVDFLSISRLPCEEQDAFAKVIATQAEKGIKMINAMSGSPTVWGAWGNATVEERKEVGKSRGGPTVKHGHFHITNFNESQQESSLKDDLSGTDKLNHFGPWSRLVHSQFSPSIAEVMEGIVNGKLNGENPVQVVPISTDVKHENNAVSSQDGYELLFSQPIDLQTLFRIMITIAGITEDFYQTLGAFHEQFYRNHENSEITSKIRDEIRSYIQDFGINEQKAIELADFVFRIKPTYGQVETWLKAEEIKSHNGIDKDASIVFLTKTIERYDRFRMFAQEAGRSSSLGLALVNDTVKPAEEYQTIERTWPVHAGFAFLIEDPLISDTVRVSKIKLLHEIATTGNGGEKILGTVLKRQ